MWQTGINVSSRSLHTLPVRESSRFAARLLAGLMPDTCGSLSLNIYVSIYIYICISHYIQFSHRLAYLFGQLHIPLWAQTTYTAYEFCAEVLNQLAVWYQLWLSVGREQIRERESNVAILDKETSCSIQSIAGGVAACNSSSKKIGRQSLNS